jgi:ribosomal-protein-alanine N-acetyltransferase
MTDLDLIETDRLVLSGWTRDQLPDLVRLHGDPTVARYLAAAGRPWTMDEMTSALDHWIDLFESRRMGKLRVRLKSDGTLVGRAGFGVEGPEEIPEIGYALYPEHWGKGYAFEAASALRDWLWRETEWDHFLGMADVRNEASRKVLRGIGMIETHVRNDGPRDIQCHILRRPA